MKRISFILAIVFMFGINAFGQDCQVKTPQSSPAGCFASGTRVMMADGSMKNIEKIVIGDKVMTYDFTSKKLVETRVSKLVETRSSDFIEFIFSGVDITIATKDHPFWTESKGWASINPRKSNENYAQDKPVELFEVNDKVFVPRTGGYSTFRNAVAVTGDFQAYTLELEKGSNFVLNGLLVQVLRAK